MEQKSQPDAAPSVLDARGRAVKSWNADGLNWIIYGLGLLAMGVAFLLEGHHREAGIGLAFNVLAVVIFVDISYSRKFLRFLKARIRYPRTGFIELPSPWARFRPDRALLSPAEQELLQRAKWLYAAVAVMLVVFIVGLHVGHRWIAAAASVWMELVFIWVFRGKFPWYAGLPLLAYGFVIAFFPADVHDSIGVALSGMGVFMLFLGIANLARYLKQHPLGQA